MTRGVIVCGGVIDFATDCVASDGAYNIDDSALKAGNSSRVVIAIVDCAKRL
jgi:hypothetical protein